MKDGSVTKQHVVAGDAVTVEGSEGAPRGPWPWAIGLPLVPLVAGLAMLMYGTWVGVGSEVVVTPELLATGSPIARVGIYVTLISAGVLAVVATADYLLC